MKRLLRTILEKLADKVLGRSSYGKRRYRHPDEDYYGWRGSKRDRQYRYRSDRKSYKRQSSLIKAIRKAF